MTFVGNRAKSNSERYLNAFLEKLQQDGASIQAQKTFAHYYRKLVKGENGLIRESRIEPLNPEIVPKREKMTHFASKGEKLLKKTAMIKLNGGLGTSMGLKTAKSLLNVIGGKSFLEIIIDQAAAQNVKLVLMNSGNTHKDTLKALKRIRHRISPLYFLQNRFPKVLQHDLAPAEWPLAPDLEWNPAGHGDIYTALNTSGMLDRLLYEGIEYAFISNSDNLGATVDPMLLGWFAERKMSFMMEVAERTPIDQKGGHLALTSDGRLILREIAQCHPEDMEAFTDIKRHQTFNTNNIWINLRFLKDLLNQEDVIRLPFIANPKNLDPRDESSSMVYQVETAMGHAITLFQGACAVRVPRSRFLPVKKSSDLMIVRSDLLRLASDGRLVPHPDRENKFPLVHLDPRFYKTIDSFGKRMRAIPSLRSCNSLEIKGDVKFEPGVTLKGDVSIQNLCDTQMIIPKGSVLQGQTRLPI